MFGGCGWLGFENSPDDGPPEGGWGGYCPPEPGGGISGGIPAGGGPGGGGIPGGRPAGGIGGGGISELGGIAGGAPDDGTAVAAPV